MNTTEFFARILPDAGLKCLFVLDSREVRFFDTREELAAAALAVDQSNTSRQAYHACAGFRPGTTSRAAENTVAFRAFWIDVDCGYDDNGNPKPYLTQQEGQAALEAFIVAANLPRPLLVNSGNGLHAYWPLDRDVTPEEWEPAAKGLKQRALELGLAHDARCTADRARVLRPVGTSNKKQIPHKAVTLMEDVDHPYDADGMLALLTEWHTEAASPLPYTANSALGGGVEYPPASAHQIATYCAQIAHYRDVRGNVSEPYWHAALGLLKHTVEGRAICHEWSNGHPEYDEQDNDRKIDRWQKAPPTCTTFNDANPGGCDGCRFRGEIKSPIALGGHLPESEPVIVPAEATQAEAAEVFVMPEALADRYSIVDGCLVGLTFDAKGKPRQVEFCSAVFYPVSHHRDEADEQRMTWRLHERSRVREFVLSGGAIGSGGTALLTELGKRGVVPTSGGSRLITAYVQDHFNHLKKKAEETRAYTHFGWQEDWSFVLGNQRYMPDGSIERVKVGGDASGRTYAPAFVPAGTLEEWIKLVDAAYNYEGQEQYQFMLGAGFGAPLIRLFESYGGVILHGFSPKKGLGKSTAGKLALGIYGNPKMLVRTKQQVTTHAFFAHCGLMSNLPVMLDEATNIEPRDLSEMAFVFSQGTPRSRLDKSGNILASNYAWSTIMLTTANRSLINTVGSSKANADAEMGRIVEFPFQLVSKLGKEDADRVLAKADTVYGEAGRLYVEYLVTHREEVKAALLKLQIDLDRRVGATTQDRFMSIGVAAVICGLSIAKALGLVQFDLGKLVLWVVRQMRQLRDTVAANLPGIEDSFGRMLAEMSEGILITKIEGDLRRDINAERINQPHGAIIGRLIQSEGVLYLNQTEVRKWCSKNQVDIGEMVQMLRGRGWLKSEPKFMFLTKGVRDMVSNSVMSWVLDWTKMSDLPTALPAEGRLHNITVVK